jgi:uncharacterized membrane protein
MKPGASTGAISPASPAAAPAVAVDPIGAERVGERFLAWCLTHRYALAVWASMAGWSAVMLRRAWSGYERFQYGRFDLGNMTQAVWSTAHGSVLESTNVMGEQASRLASHVDPILVLQAPLWLVWPSPLSLVLVQVVSIALGALPVFWLARKHLGSERPACLLALAYLVYPWVTWTTLDAVHPKSLALPLLLFAFWFLDSDRLVPFAAFAVLAASTGELTGLTIGALGIWYAVEHRRRWAGTIIALAGFASTLIALEVIIPAFSGGQSGAFAGYASLGGSPQGMVRTLFTNPGAYVHLLVSGDNLLYVVLLGAPLAAAFLLAPWLAVVAAPRLLINMLADSGGTTDPRQHYQPAIIATLFVASIIGVARLAPAWRARAAVVVLASSLAFTLSLGPWSWAPGAPLWNRGAVSPGHVDALRRAASLVPADAPVSSTNSVGSHLSARHFVYTVPVVGRATWIVVDQEDPAVWSRVGGTLVFRSNPVKLRRFTERVERSPSWTRVFDEDGVLVFRHAAAS